MLTLKRRIVALKNYVHALKMSSDEALGQWSKLVNIMVFHVQPFYQHTSSKLPVLLYCLVGPTLRSRL